MSRRSQGTEGFGMTTSNSVIDLDTEALNGGAGPDLGGSGGFAASSFVIGSNDAESLLGGDGPDFVDGLGGGDTASGAGGDDLIIGGAGDDSLAGDGTFEFPDAAPGSGNDTLWGGAGDDTLYADGFDYSPQSSFATSNVLFGGTGDDFIVAGYGEDVVDGGSGNDVILGHGYVVVQLGGTPGGSALARENDRADLLLGGSGDDYINGGGGDDTIYGGSGDDRLSGDVGNDSMAGGAGADSFLFSVSISTFTVTDETGRGEGNRDVVIDFQTGVDVLDFSGLRNFGYGVRWEYEEQDDRTIVYIGRPSQQEVEIELRGVSDLTANDVVL